MGGKGKGVRNFLRVSLDKKWTVDGGEEEL